MSFKNTLLTLSSVLLIHSPVWATQSQDHEHEHFPEGTLLAFEGVDSITQEECFLFVTDVGNANNVKTYKVETSYHHDDDHPAAIDVQVSPKNPQWLTGEDAQTQSKIVIQLATDDQDIRTANSYTIKWLHGNHFHTNKCVQLTPHID